MPDEFCREVCSCIKGVWDSEWQSYVHMMKGMKNINMAKRVGGKNMKNQSSDDGE